ncbi:MAG TPA: YtpI family protein [Planococcus sp. (in: firmicutes)]|jgi:amino acid transporter|nr:YtpI family protein [Planococcus sp. (in: firmicutes)]
MLIFVFLIIVSFVFYFYYKTKQFRTKLPVRKNWYKSRASIALGSFVAFFGINQVFLYQSALTYLIAGIFISLGIGLITYNYKAAKHYQTFLDEETRLNP